MSRWSLRVQYLHPTLKTGYGPRGLSSRILDFPAVRKGMLMRRQLYVTSCLYAAKYNFLQLEQATGTCIIVMELYDTSSLPPCARSLWWLIKIRVFSNQPWERRKQIPNSWATLVPCLQGRDHFNLRQQHHSFRRSDRHHDEWAVERRRILLTVNDTRGAFVNKKEAPQESKSSVMANMSICLEFCWWQSECSISK
jgi:hypothetical protein